MRCAECAVADAAADADDHNRIVGIGCIYLYLFSRTHTVKAGRSDDEYLFSHICHSCGNRHGILLGNPNFDKLVRQFFRKIAQLGTAS